MKKAFFSLLAAAACLGGSMTNASAAIFLLEATIDGAQASAGSGTGSMGVGTMTGSYNDGGTPLTGGTFSWNILYSGLTGTPTLAHFHGAALPNQNAGVQVGIGLDNPAISSTVISASQASDLLSHLWYINIHTDEELAGEIRGQVVPEPSRGLLALIGLLPVVLRRRR